MKSSILTLTGFLMSCCVAMANPTDSLQTGDTNSTKEIVYALPYQITFIPPMGTNGQMSKEMTNHLSLNIVAGYNGGLEGLEIGGFANVLKSDAQGTQVAGFANVVMGELHGIQIAGFGNIVEERSKGIQIAGFTNQSKLSSKVIQIGGFSNQLTGSTKGGQVAGFANYTADSLEGIQIAGFGNHAGGSSKGMQIGGFMNNSADIKGMQIAGFANVSKNIKGGQISGFLNKADTVDGLQIGFINLADTFTSGIPIGFFSNVSNGYRSFSFGVNEMQQISGDFHIGVPQFYNIFSLAISPIPGSESWAYGYGIGSKILNRTKSNIAIEGLAYQVNEREFWNNANNMLIRLQPKYEFHPTGGKFALWAGPSVNLLVSGLWDGRGDEFQSELAPYELIKEEGKYNVYRLWAGGQVGIKF